MNYDDAALRATMEIDEGKRRHIYVDTEGHPSVGIGRNLDAKPMPPGWACPLSDHQIDELYAEDMGNVFTELDARCPWWRKMTEGRQRVLANMCFNLGWPKLSQFVNTLAAMASGDYEKAADGMRASRWAKQVGARATRLIAAMRRG